MQSPRPLARRTVMYLINQVLKRSGVKTPEVMVSHGFRKFAITMMIKAKVDYNTREYLVGHRKSMSLDQHYDRTSEEDRLAEYAKAINLLTIDPNQRLYTRIKELEGQQAERISNLQMRLQQQDAELESTQWKLQQYDAELTATKDELAKISQQQQQQPHNTKELEEMRRQIIEIKKNISSLIDVVEKY